MGVLRDRRAAVTALFWFLPAAPLPGAATRPERENKLGEIKAGVKQGLGLRP